MTETTSDIILPEAKNHKEEAVNQAILEAAAGLAGLDLAVRSAQLGLPGYADDCLPLRMFAKDMLFRPEGCSLTDRHSGQPAKPADLLLLLHYLQCELPVVRTGELVTFRDFSGGQFYYQPFLSRSVNILLGRFGNQIDSLRANLARFDCTPLAAGDVAAEIHAFGPLSVTVVYRGGDEEFGPSADVLFDAAVKRALCAEDAAVIATRICVGLL